MYGIIWTDGQIRESIDEHGKANKYGKPKMVGTYKQAKSWVDKHSYKGMSFRYVIHEMTSEEVKRVKEWK